MKLSFRVLILMTLSLFSFTIWAAEPEEKLDLQAFNALKSADRPVVALVLGSGGARGYAHIGVIELLERYDIQPDFIVGSSAGSLVGALYAQGKSAAELKHIAMNMKTNDVRGFRVAKNGFFDGQKIADFVNQQVNQQQLQDLKIPMYVVATELKYGERTVFNYGDTGLAVRASVSIPSMFNPPLIGGREYVDGGLVSPVPVDVARQLGADIVIAVNILAQPKHTQTDSIWGLFNQNINIMQQHLARQELQGADVVIQPDLREKAHIFDTKIREETIQIGYDSAEQKIQHWLQTLAQQPEQPAYRWLVQRRVTPNPLVQASNLLVEQ